ncbi:uncharacterized protein AMSG_03946 [Thecamonas trahens ATCC 50062]|uniref:Nudix hydrolase domain-containing protein n=1 Tax=Thecamonas trahens ATCC 50062 TaxID=461836 RepID=A0A0L0D692_THETB|nr:hypothetical protein AMSG_03946 [Thecamonas trahens ATCC 50062]KNC47715.1 hypothetical protein AMSG_03946 [Thecamonas trahens ATCC 50062]|eukprot:XP_013759197.1 hypothetical protein AMSG_03946 [Thecamonas trahens ATCC 50062]
MLRQGVTSFPLRWLARAASGAADARLVGATILQRFPLVAKADPPAVAAYKALAESKAAETRKTFPAEVYADRRSAEAGSDAAGAVPPAGAGPAVGTSFWDKYETPALDLAVPVGEVDAAATRAAADAGELQTTARAVDASLYLLLRKDRDDHPWQFPQGGWEDGETMRQTAERELKEEVGDEAPVYFVSNALFFYRAWYLGDNGSDIVPNADEGLVGYAWATKAEVAALISPDVFPVIEPLLDH